MTAISGQTKKIETAHFNAKYELEAEEYALASLQILESAWSIAANNGFLLPEKIRFSILRTDRSVLYFNRKNLKEIRLEYSSLTSLLPPDESKKNNIYGLCHEIGHLCMYNTTHNRNNWMSYDYRESWADYFGNFIIDSIYKQFGIDCWPEPHDYRKYSGMEYLIQRIEKNDPKLQSFNKASLFWHELNLAIGFNNLHGFFEEVNIQKVNNPNAKEKYLEVLSGYLQKSELEEWFQQYADYLILNEKKSY